MKKFIFQKLFFFFCVTYWLFTGILSASNGKWTLFWFMIALTLIATVIEINSAIRNHPLRED